MSQKIHADDPEAQLSVGLCKDITDKAGPEELQGLIDSHSVIMFSKSSCPFCFELKRLLKSYGVAFAVFEVNKVPNTAALQDKLKEMSGIRTVPNVFIDGKSHGGCRDFKAVEFSLGVRQAIGKHMTGNAVPEERIRTTGLFFFPAVVNGHIMRLTSLMTCFVAILCVGLYNYPATKWVALGLAIDFIMRFVFGGSNSIGGQLSMVILAHVPPKWGAGPPKQFAAFCGLFMSVVGATLYLADIPIGGAALMAGLAGAAGLEGIFDFCLGCWMFGHGIAFGIISPQVYRPFLSEVESRKWAYSFVHAPTRHPFPTREAILLPGQTKAEPINIVRKTRNEVEYKFAHPNIIRHAEVSLFFIPAVIAIQAFQYKLVGDGSRNLFDGSDFAEWGTKIPFQVLFLLSVVLFGAIFILYTLRAVLHRKKVMKEWSNPISGNAFIAIPVTLCLFGVMHITRDGQKDLATVLIWIGCTLMMAFTLVRVADLIMYRISRDFVSPAKLMLPIGNFFSAIALAACAQEDAPNHDGDLSYLFLSRVWFGAGVGLSLLLVPITFHRAMLDAAQDPRLRPFMWMWGMLSSIAGVATFAVSGYDPAVGRGIICQSLWGLSVYLFGSYGLLWLRGFFSYADGSNGMWAMAMAASAFSLSTTNYYFTVDHLFMRVFTQCTMAASGALTAVCFLTSLSKAVDLSLFRASVRWGPLSFMLLTHEMFRFVIPRLRRHIEDADYASCPAAMDALAEDMLGLLITYTEHGRHEEEVFFPMVRRYFPHLNPSMDEEHRVEHVQVERMMSAIVAYRSARNQPTPVALLVAQQGSHRGGNSEEKSGSGNDIKELGDTATQLLSVLKEVFPAWGEHLLSHLRNEEASVSVIARKSLPWDVTVDMNRRVLDSGSEDTWAVVMPYMVKHIPMPEWKVRFVKTFLVSNYPRAHEIGLMIYRGVDSVLWAWISSEIPDIIPRGLPGYRKIY